MDNTMKSSTFNLGEVLAEAGIKTVDALPAKEPEPKKEEPQGGAFMAGHGRMMYKYQWNGEAIVTPKPLEQMTEQDFYDLPVSLIGAEAGRLPQNLTVKW